jgi:hypothetical protein
MRAFFFTPPASGTAGRRSVSWDTCPHESCRARAPPWGFFFLRTIKNVDTGVSKYGIWSGNPAVHQLQCSSFLPTLAGERGL